MIKPPRLLDTGRLQMMLLLVLIGILQAAATVSSSYLTKTIFDRIVSTEVVTATEELVVFGGGLALMAVLIGYLCMAERVVAEKIGQSYAETVRLALYDRLTTLPKRALQNRSNGGVMLRFIGDLTALRHWVSLGMARLIVIGLTTVGSLIALAFLNATLAATVGFVLVVGACISIGRARKMRSASRESRRSMSRLAANINEKIYAISVLQVFGQLLKERERMLRQSRQLRETMVAKAGESGKIRGLAEGFAAFAYGSALVVGAIQVNLAKTSPGSVIAALTVISLLVPKLRDLGRVQEYWHGFCISKQKMIEFLNIPSQIHELPDAKDISPGLGRLEFKAVCSGILQNISVTAEPGKVIAIVGPNGAGKSTLISLAARLFDPDSGMILIDEQNISQYTLASVRRLVGVAGQDYPLLRGTLEKNLIYRFPHASDTDRQRVKQQCGLDEVLATFPDGEQTRISEAGANLSAGQRQRFALARALLGNPPILLLDEADTNLDAQANTLIDQVLANHTGTVLFTSHDIQRVAKADVIWFIDNGYLLEVGSPEELMTGTGPTARFFANSQETALNKEFISES